MGWYWTLYEGKALTRPISEEYNKMAVYCPDSEEEEDTTVAAEGGNRNIGNLLPAYLQMACDLEYHLLLITTSRFDFCQTEHASVKMIANFATTLS